MTAKLRTILSTALVALAAAFILVGCQAPSSQGDAEGTTESSSSNGAAAAVDVISEVDPSDPYGTGVHHARIDVEGYGSIEVTLNANVAPITVSNFCHLAEDGFYDGLTFHRVVPGFMIQGGDPEGNGTGGSDACIKGEFSDNGVENSIPHVRGTISMARATDPDSASSQFFIMQEEASYLDGQYAAFGTVTSGMGVVDAICEDVPVADEASGLVSGENQPVISKVEILD